MLNRWHKLTLEFQVYEYGAVVEQQGTFSGIPAVTMAVSNPGNILTPIRLEITPTAGIASLTISGVCMDPDTGEEQPISLKNLTTGNTVVLDGETGLVTEKGALKSKDTEMWTLPALSPGTTTLTCSTGTLSIRVKLYPDICDRKDGKTMKMKLGEANCNFKCIDGNGRPEPTN